MRWLALVMLAACHAEPALRCGFVVENDTLYDHGRAVGHIRDGTAWLDGVPVGRIRHADGTRLALVAARQMAGCVALPATVVDEHFAPLPHEPGTIVDLDGSLWATLDGNRFVRPAHDRPELDARRAVIATVGKRLPTDEAARLLPVAGVIASVSVIEGDFGDPTRIATDTAVSLGIFQWAASRRQPVALDSSLGRFFTRLATRAKTDAQAADAWAECRGIDFEGGFVRWQRRPVNAEILVGKMLPKVATGALRVWQLRLALEEVEALQKTLPPSLAGNEVVLAIALSLTVNRPAYRAGVIGAAAADVDRGSDPVLAMLERAVERYPPSDRARRSRRFVTALLLYPL